MLWLLSFIEAVVYTTIATAVGYWYFVETQDDPDGDGDIDGDGIVDKSFAPLCTSIARVLRYHLGSMAMGAFVLSAVRLVRILMAWLDEQMRRTGFRDALLVQVCLKCIQCLLWCFEKSVKCVSNDRSRALGAWGALPPSLASPCATPPRAPPAPLHWHSYSPPPIHPGVLPPGT